MNQGPDQPNVLPYERFPEPVPLASFPEAGEACMAASKLESEGIECAVVEHSVLQGIGARGAVLAVEAEQYQKAVEVLAATPARRCLLVQKAEPAEGDVQTQRPPGVPAGGVVTHLLSRLALGLGLTRRRATGR